MAKQFPQYRPWSRSLWNVVRRSAWSGTFFMLDVQLGSECNARCWYCDSSCCQRQEPAELDVKAVKRLASKMAHHYMYQRRSVEDPNWLQGFICGWGEPTAGANLERLKELVAETEGIFSWAMFNNGIYWDDDLSRLVKQKQLAVQVQCNGSDPDEVARRMGISRELALQQIANRERLYQESYEMYQTNPTNTTQVCASIVPDRQNRPNLLSWTEQAVRKNVFPLIAELEEAGLCTGKTYEDNKLANRELSYLRYQIWREMMQEYEVPFCPAAVGAIHVNNHNKVTVDRATGLSCGWFSMDASDQVVLGDIREDSLEVLSQRILEYRKSRIEAVRGMVYEYPHMVFGGCGGNARYLLQAYVRSYDEHVAVISGSGWPGFTD